MRKRPLFLGLALLLIVVVVLFVIYGIPLVQAMFTPAITGLPPTASGNSLQARFTQTALARSTNSANSANTANTGSSGTPSPQAK